MGFGDHDAQNQSKQRWVSFCKNTIISYLTFLTPKNPFEDILTPKNPIESDNPEPVTDNLELHKSQNVYYTKKFLL